MQLNLKEEPTKLEKAAESKFALPVGAIGIGAAVIAVLFAGRIIDMLIVPVVAVVAFYLGKHHR